MRFTVTGGKPLRGEIALAGSKNAATPIIAATVLTGRPCVLANVPRIGDVLTMLELLTRMGSRVRWLGEHEVEIINDRLDPAKLDQVLVSKIRSSILLVGPLLVRFGAVEFVTPGGCHKRRRPIYTPHAPHAPARARVAYDPTSGMHRIELTQRAPRDLTLREFSVTATEIMLTVGAAMPLTLRLAATEPHVADLCAFLAKLGLTIEGAGTHWVRVRPPAVGGSGPVRHTIIADMIEAGTFAIAGAITRGVVTITGAVAGHLEAVLGKLREMGVPCELAGDRLTVRGAPANLLAAKIETRPFPGLMTDLQAPFGVLATQAHGTSLIFDTLYEGRLRYLDELKKMGADATILDPHRALVKGPTRLHAGEVNSLDLRAGATLIIAALVAEGTSVLHEAEQIDRGYERIDERLRGLGAEIERSA